MSLWATVDSIGETTTGGIPDWLTQSLVTVASALIITTVLWLVRRAGRIRATWGDIKKRLQSIDSAVNQRAAGEPTLVDMMGRVDRRLIKVEDQQRIHTAWLHKIDRQVSSRPTFEQVLTAAAVLHPDLDVEDLDEVVHGDDPPLSDDDRETLRAQAREIARRRAERDGPDNPEEHT